MSALTFASGPDLAGARARFHQLRTRFGPAAAVVGIHAILFSLIASGLMTRMVDAALPPAVQVTFVAPPKPTPAAPAPPRTEPLVALPPPELPAVAVPPVQLAIHADAVDLDEEPVQPQQAAAAPAARSVAPAPPAPLQDSKPKTVTTGVEYIQAPQPIYPLMSKRMGEQGRVMLRILVNTKGMPDQVQVQTSSGSARLDEAGRQAALRAQFKPFMEDGHPVAVYVIVPLNFQLSS